MNSLQRLFTTDPENARALLFRVSWRAVRFMHEAQNLFGGLRGAENDYRPAAFCEAGESTYSSCLRGDFYWVHWSRLLDDKPFPAMRQSFNSL